MEDLHFDFGLTFVIAKPLGNCFKEDELGDDEVVGEEGVAEGLLWRALGIGSLEEAEVELRVFLAAEEGGEPRRRYGLREGHSHRPLDLKVPFPPMAPSLPPYLNYVHRPDFFIFGWGRLKSLTSPPPSNIRRTRSSIYGDLKIRTAAFPPLRATQRDLSCTWELTSTVKLMLSNYVQRFLSLPTRCTEWFLRVWIVGSACGSCTWQQTVSRHHSRPDISSLSELQVLSLVSNGFSGSFPWCYIKNMRGLQVQLVVGDSRSDSSPSFPEEISRPPRPRSALHVKLHYRRESCRLQDLGPTDPAAFLSLRDEEGRALLQILLHYRPSHHCWERSVVAVYSGSDSQLREAFCLLKVGRDGHE
ncbi:hypothetical protein CRG98_046579 [Punica granatum]|uniref:Uncharacterized protein n=1 Tax=Punica granatum TaxID=22663 RepID=A0A2I0HMQ5_PUNGR|nr:hypothetical protein CRG98_046579 [Punica granatum]